MRYVLVVIIQRGDEGGGGNIKVGGEGVLRFVRLFRVYRGGDTEEVILRCFINQTKDIDSPAGFEAKNLIIFSFSGFGLWSFCSCVFAS